MIKSLDKVLQDPKLNIRALKALVENSFDSILITDASNRTRILYANKAFKKLTGYNPAEVLGKTPKILQGAATDKTVIARLSKTLSDGGRFEGKAINYKKDGTPFLMHWRVVPVKLGKDTSVLLAIQRETSSI